MDARIKHQLAPLIEAAAGAGRPIFAVFAVVAGNLQRAAPYFWQKSCAFGPQAPEKTAGRSLFFAVLFAENSELGKHIAPQIPHGPLDNSSKIAISHKHLFVNLIMNYLHCQRLIPSTALRRARASRRHTR